MKARTLTTHLYRRVLFPLVGSLLISFTFCEDCFGEDIDEYLVNAIFSFLLWNSLGYGSLHLVIRPLDRKFSWLHHPTKRAVFGFIASIAFVLLTLSIFQYLLIEFYYKGNYFEILSNGHLNTGITVSTSISVVISLFFHARGFFIAWKETAVQNEKLKAENINTKFESLRNQVNPHFLFNSLNTLASLVENEDEKAVDFIHQLSGVYRYVLIQNDNEVVALTDELNFVKSYLTLHQVRFGKNISVDYIDMDKMTEEQMLPPLSLQLLVENCIKHNEISNDRKLNITISHLGNQINISNNINELNHAKKDSTQLGLSNLKSRYSYLSDNPVIIHNSNGQFSVTIPLITSLS